MENSPVCRRRVLHAGDITQWINSKGYNDYVQFIKEMNEFSKEFHNQEIVKDNLVEVVKMLSHLSDLVDEIKPFDKDDRQR